MRAFTILALLASASAIKVDFAAAEWRTSPIQRVVGLLKEMQGQLTHEADEDEDQADKLGCWCHTNDKEKTKAISDATQRVADLGSAVEEFTAKSAQLKTELESLNKQVAEQTNSLEEATAMRTKDNNEFYNGEKDAIAQIGSLKGAVMTLGKQHGEFNQESFMQVKHLLKRQMDAHQRMFHESALKGSQHRLVLSLLQQPEEGVSAMLQAPQSGAIFGILKQMKESFETNLKTSQDNEATAKAEFAEMKAAKSAEISAAEELIDSKSVELAQTDESNANSKQDNEDTARTLEADTEFLANLKTKCATADSEYEARQKVRNEEIGAVSETINILTSDDAKDMLNKNFIQLSSRTVRMSARRARAANLLQQKAKELHRPRLMALSMSMRADVFAKVKVEIDAMVGALKKEQADEVQQKDFCIKELHENEMQTTEKNNLKEDLTQQIADSDTTVSELKEALTALHAQVDATHVEMKRASENRLAANKEFQVTVTDQKATQAILTKAINKLKSFYAKKAFLQVRQAAQKYSKSGAASGVMSMIEGIIQESKEVEKEALQAENDAMAGYNSFMADSNTAIAAMNQDIANKSEELAKSDITKVKAQGDLRHAGEDVLMLEQYASELHAQCDFLTKHFDIRQQSRASEIEALQQAKAIFSNVN